jgi:hypothetical protein
MPAATHTIYPYPQGLDIGQRMLYVYGTVSFSSGTYPAGGFPAAGSATCVWAAGSQQQVTSNLAPTQVSYQSIAHPPSGYVYAWDQSAQTLRIFLQTGTAAPLAELSGAIPAGVLSDLVSFELIIPKD